MSISVIIPVYNQAGLVGSAIQSALAQTLTADEIIVADDGSTDDSAAVVSRFKEPVRLIRLPHGGPAAARNRAVQAARGEWLAFLDADDLWLPGKLQAQMEIAEKENPDLIHTDGWVVEGTEATAAPPGQSTYFADRVPPQGPDPFSAFLSCPLLTPSVLLQRAGFEQAGGFDESFQIHEDADLYLRVMAGGGRVVYVPQPLVVIRNSGPGRDRFSSLVSLVRMLEQALSRFPRRRPELRAALLRTHRIAARYYLAQNQKPLALRSFVRSFRYYPPSLGDLKVVLLLGWGGKMGEAKVRSAWREMMDQLR